MSYSLEIHPFVNEDVLEIFQSINENSPLQADLFAENVLLEYEKILNELNQNIFHQNKRIIKSRPIGKFRNHRIFNKANLTEEKLIILAVVYGGRDQGRLQQMINNRLE